MQARSSSTLAGFRVVPAHSTCPPHPYLSPLRLPANRCFVSRSARGAALGSRSRTQLNVSAAAAVAQANPLSLLGSASGDVFVAGATGPLGARITQELLLAGFKVTAGAADIEEAQGLLDFARRFELIRKEQSQKLSLAEVDFSDEDSIAASIPRRGSKVVIALGDTAGRQRIDAKVASRIVEAAQAAGASQLVLVAPSGAGGGGGGFFGGFLGGGGGSSSAVEEEVVNSGIQCVVLRTGTTNVDESSAVQSGVSLGIQGSKPSNASISKSQVAQVVAQALRQADTDVAIEAWADRSAAPRDLAQLMAEVLPLATIEGAEEEEEEEEDDQPEPVAELSSAVDEAASSDAAQEAKRAAGGLFGRAKRTAQEVTGEEEPGEAPKAALGGLFGRAKRTAQEVTGEEEPEEAPKAALGGLFGRAKKAAQDTTGEAQPEKKPAKALGGLFGRAKRATEEAIDEIESEPKPKPFAGLLGGTKKVSVEAQQGAKEAGRRAASGGKRAAREAQSAAQQAAPRRGGLFGRAQPPPEEPVKEGNPLSQLLGGGKKAAKEAEKGGKQVRVSAQAAQKNVKQSAAKLRSTAGKAAASAEPEKKTGPLSWLGIGQDTVYAEDD
ncbi:g5794 [Coccomyxa viridis]|uniref:G5794 protein n=1 Tax=Coccomyxa viridis TaxID=1274662 RepID=A0ABP1FYM1_9CHLO